MTKTGSTALALLGALALANCKPAPRQAEFAPQAQPGREAADELRAEEDLEARIRANVAERAGQRQRESDAADDAFLAGLDDQRNAAVAAALQASNAQAASDRRDRLGDMVANDVAPTTRDEAAGIASNR